MRTSFAVGTLKTTKISKYARIASTMEKMYHFWENRNVMKRTTHGVSHSLKKASLRRG